LQLATRGCHFPTSKMRARETTMQFRGIDMRTFHNDTRNSKLSAWVLTAPFRVALLRRPPPDLPRSPRRPRAPKGVSSVQCQLNLKPCSSSTAISPQRHVPTDPRPGRAALSSGACARAARSRPGAFRPARRCYPERRATRRRRLALPARRERAGA